MKKILILFVIANIATFSSSLHGLMTRIARSLPYSISKLPGRLNTPFSNPQRPFGSWNKFHGNFKKTFLKFEKKYPRTLSNLAVATGLSAGIGIHEYVIRPFVNPGDQTWQNLSYLNHNLSQSNYAKNHPEFANMFNGTEIPEEIDGVISNSSEYRWLYKFNKLLQKAINEDDQVKNLLKKFGDSHDKKTVMESWTSRLNEAYWETLKKERERYIDLLFSQSSASSD